MSEIVVFRFRFVFSHVFQRNKLGEHGSIVAGALLVNKTRTLVAGEISRMYWIKCIDY